jgi:hypothetical protein
MKQAKVFFWIVAALVGVAVIALVIPRSPFYLPILLNGGEGAVEGHGVRYWIKDLDNPEQGQRTHAIHALGAMGPEAGDAVPALAKVLVEGKATQDRIEAALALSKMVPASRSAVPALAQALEDQDLLVRMNAAMALQRLGAESRPAIPALIKAVKDKSNKTNVEVFPITIQEQAAVALGRATAGTAEGVPTLIEALQEVRADKSVKIQTINRGEGESRMTSTKAPTANSHRSSNPIIRAKINISRALGEIGPEAQSAVPLLRDMIKEDQISDFKIYAEEAIQKIEAKPADAK